MKIDSITIKNFRNHTYSSYRFTNGLNVITGDNAVGKTNLVEAIYYLSLARSFRGVETNELIKKGKDQAEIHATVSEGKIKREIDILIANSTRRVFINGKPVSRLSELSKCVNIVLFEPKDVLLFKGSPKERRTFIDVNLSKKSETYLELISKYERVLKERNELLKQDKVDLTLLDATTEMLIKLEGPIISYRQLYFKDINDILIKLTHALTGVYEKIEVSYKPFIPYTQDFEINAKEAYKRSLDNDLKKKATTIGIHREDFSTSLNSKDIALYGSQGENRIVALALKLAPYFLIGDDDKKPITILDDVMSELDDEHQKTLIRFLKKMKQVFITATKLEITGASHYQIKKQNTKEVF